MYIVCPYLRLTELWKILAQKFDIIMLLQYFIFVQKKIFM